MAGQPIFPTKVSITIDTMLNIDGDIDGHGDGDIRCKQTLNSQVLFIVFQESHQVLPERLGPDSVQVRLLGWNGPGQVKQTGAETQFCEYTVYLRSFSSALALI